MRRRVSALLCVLALCAAIQIPGRAASNGEVFFTAVNITVLPLTSDTMPVWSGGLLYVPYSVFNTTLLGTSSIYSRSNNTVSVFNLRQMMVFDLDEGVCRDHQSGEVIPGQAIFRNGRPYVPVEYVCSFFGFNPPSYLTTSYGSLVRITNFDRSDPHNMSDAAFLDAGSETFRMRLRDYNQSLQSQDETSQPTQPTEPEPEPAENPLYVAVRCGQAGRAEDVAAALESAGGVGVFFFPAREAGEQGALIRRLLGAGHSVGLLAEGEDTAQTRQLLEEGQRALETVARARTYLALVPDAQRPALEEDGWVCWQTGTDAAPQEGTSSYSTAQSAARALAKSDVPHLTLDDSAGSAEIFGYLLSPLGSQGYVVTPPRETQL